MANEKRLIDANDIDYENIMCSQSQLHWLNAIIEAQPTVDAVEVVRCKDCKEHRDVPDCEDVICKRYNTFKDPLHFCSYGERRNNEID